MRRALVLLAAPCMALMLTAAEARREASADAAAGELGAAWARYGGGRDGLRLLRDSLLPQVLATRDAARAALVGGQADFVRGPPRAAARSSPCRRAPGGASLASSPARRRR